MLVCDLLRSIMNAVCVTRAHCTARLIVTNKRSAFFVVQDATSTMREKYSPKTLDDPEERKHSEDEGRPVNKCRGGLMLENSEQRPRDRNRSGEIAFRRRECIGCCGSLKEEPALQLSEILMAQSHGRSHSQAQKDKDLGPDTCPVCDRIDAERLKGSQNYEDSRPSMVKGERKMNPKLVVDAL